MASTGGIDPRAQYILCVALTLTACTKESVTAVTLTGLSVSPPAISTLQGERIQFSATVRDERDGMHGPPMVWSSDDESVVTVDEAGFAQAVSPGTTKVRASFRDMFGEALVTVVPRARPPRPPDDPDEDTDDPPDDDPRGKTKKSEGRGDSAAAA